MVHVINAANSAKAASRLGFLASLIGASADSNPPYANINSTIALIQTDAGIAVDAPQGAWRTSVTAAPAVTTINNGTIFATVNMLLKVAPCRAPRALMTARSPTRMVRITKRGQGSFAAGQNSAR